MHAELKSTVSGSLAELRRQQKENEAKIAKVLESERSSRFIDHVRSIVAVIVEDKELALGYVPLIRKDYMVRDVLRTLPKKRGTPQDVNEVLGDVLTPILDAGKDSLTEIRSILVDRSRTEEKDEKGNVKTLRPLFKDLGNETYTLAE